MTTTSHFSLNQVDQTCRKAAKGIGLPWGLADDIGKAVRWLVAFRLVDLTTVVRYLQDYSHAHYFDVIPQNLTSPLSARSGILNPLMTGMVLSDQLATLFETGNSQPAGQVIECSTIDHPILLAGFLGQTALAKHQALSLRWAGVELVFYREEITIQGIAEDLGLDRVDQVTCQACEFPSQGDPSIIQPIIQPIIGGVEIDTVIWQQLEKMAHHTYVEATEQSRNEGAGAGLNDND